MKIIPIVLISLATLWPSMAPAAIDRDRSQYFYEKALESLRGDSLTESVIQLRNALQQDPNNLPARITLGRILLQQDQPDAAIKELEKAHAMGGDENLILVPLATAYLELANPQQVLTAIISEGHQPQVDGELRLLQAEASLLLGDRKGAQEFYLSAGTLLPVDPRPIIGRAKLALSSGKRDRASKLIEEAVLLAPESFGAWLFKAIFHRDHQQYKAAAAAFERALELDPTSGRALTARAAMWMDRGQTEKAKQDLAQVRNLGGETLEAVYLRTLLMFREGRGEEAREILRQRAGEIRSLKEQYRDVLPTTRLMLGVVAFFEGNHDEAISHLKQFLTAIPGHLGAKRYLAAAYLSIGEFQQVIRLYKPSAGKPLPRDPMALSILAEAYRATGALDQSEALYEAAMKLAPSAAGLGVRLAGARLEAGRPEAAAEELERMLKRFPDLTDAWLQLARVYMKSGRLKDAKNTVRSMLDRFPDDPLVHNMAGGVYLAAGDFAAAESELRLAATMDPELILPQLNLARLARAKREHASAEAQYRLIVERFPHHSTANLELARLLLLSGELEEAMERVDGVMRQEPLYFEAHELRIALLVKVRGDSDRLRNAVYELTSVFAENPQAELVAGDVYRRLGQKADARVHFRRAVEKAEFDTGVLYPAAERQFSIEDYRGALWSLTKADQGSPGLERVATLRAAVLIKLREFDKARETITKAREGHGDSAGLRLVAGDLEMALGRFSQAVTEYRKAFETAPAYKTLQVYFRSLVAVNDIDKATETVTGWLQRNPNDIRASHLYAQLLSREKQYGAAQEMYEKLREQGVEDIVLLNNLASAYQHIGDARAVPTAALAYEQAPDNPSVIDTYGWILTENGRIDEGLALLRDAYARSSTNPLIRVHIGSALARLGRIEEAVDEIEAALEIGERFAGREDALTFLEELKTQAVQN